MKPLLLALVFSVFSTLGFAEDYPVAGPENLRQHVPTAKQEADKFLRYFDLSNLRSAHDMTFKSISLRTREDYLKQFGSMQSRELVGVRVADSFPPLADATFVIFNYKASFAKKKFLPQQVVVRIGADGKPQIAVFNVSAF